MSLDAGPMETNTNESDRISFRFATGEWKAMILPLLVENNVPFELLRSYYADADPTPRKKTIYIAEDDLNILFALNTILEDAGYEVVLSHCGPPMLEPNLPETDLFILDKRMPGVDGIEICKHLKNQQHTKDIPVIMISASRNVAKEAYAAGVNAFLEKPFQMKELLKLVAQHTTSQSQGSSRDNDTLASNTAVTGRPYSR